MPFGMHHRRHSFIKLNARDVWRFFNYRQFGEFVAGPTNAFDVHFHVLSRSPSNAMVSDVFLAA